MSSHPWLILFDYQGGLVSALWCSWLWQHSLLSSGSNSRKSTTFQWKHHCGLPWNSQWSQKNQTCFPFDIFNFGDLRFSTINLKVQLQFCPSNIYKMLKFNLKLSELYFERSRCQFLQNKLQSLTWYFDPVARDTEEIYLASDLEFLFLLNLFLCINSYSHLPRLLENAIYNSISYFMK